MSAKSKSTQPKSQVELKDESLLQAVLLVDPFGTQQSWGPLVKQDDDEDEDDEDRSRKSLPWCLLPLLGTPLLLWTLDSLALGGVQQVFLFVRHDLDKIQSFLSKTIYLNPDSPISLTIIPTTAFTPGDVLREVDSRALLKTKTGDGSDIGTFILARCGYIGNLDLIKASQSFSACRKLQAGLPCLSAIMKSKPDHISSSTSTTVHLLDQSSRLLCLHTDQRKFPQSKQIQIPIQLLQQPQDLLLRADLESIGIDLCSVEVPQLFTENFDYQDVRPDFIHGILTSDLLGKTILCDIVNETNNLGSGVNWVTSVSDVKSYDRASRDIIARRAQPFVLEQARLGAPPPLTQRRGMVYIGKDVDLAPDCTIGNSTCLSPGCTISHHALIRQSYIGSSTQVESDSEITNSYVFDQVLINSNTRIRNSIIGSHVHIQSDCLIEDGCLIGNGVVIGRGSQLRGVNVSLTGPNGSSKLEGPDSVGVVWPNSEDPTSHRIHGQDSDESESEEEKIDIRNVKYARLGTTRQNSFLVSPSSSTTSLSSLSSNASSSISTQIQNISLIGEMGSTKDFFIECVRSLERAFEEDHTVDNATIELKTLRMASNVAQSKVRSVVLKQVCQLVHKNPHKLQKWGRLIRNLLSVEEDLQEMQDVLLDLQEWCAENLQEDKAKFFSKLLQYFYNEDIVGEEGIIKWFRSALSKQAGGAEGLKLREIGGKFLQMLMDAEEESDSDEE
ncbi:hypothetical protein O181_026070 [Austropuccinia psidii MF-1]|uniref:Translation initiation factor eIF2B subunit epsilon n=1 Tax=Austropuccinia psidii MF-1 TaxID=1389203 RepID=A0A9Q3H1T9_9BASI|nr:hypothetical protein [Austropuccinia psidii MF-1]